MKHSVIHTKGMSCSHCEKRVENGLKGNAKIHDCKADAKSGDVMITHEDDYDINEANMVIQDFGYEVMSNS